MMGEWAASRKAPDGTIYTPVGFDKYQGRMIVTMRVGAAKQGVDLFEWIQWEVVDEA